MHDGIKRLIRRFWSFLLFLLYQMNTYLVTWSGENCEIRNPRRDIKEGDSIPFVQPLEFLPCGLAPAAVFGKQSSALILRNVEVDSSHKDIIVSIQLLSEEKLEKEVPCSASIICFWSTPFSSSNSRLFSSLSWVGWIIEWERGCVAAKAWVTNVAVKKKTNRNKMFQLVIGLVGLWYQPWPWAPPPSHFQPCSSPSYPHDRNGWRQPPYTSMRGGARGPSLLLSFWGLIASSLVCLSTMSDCSCSDGRW